MSNIYEALRRSEALAKAQQQGGVSKQDGRESSEPVPLFPREVLPGGGTPTDDVTYPTEGEEVEGPNLHSPAEEIGSEVGPRSKTAPIDDSGLVVASPRPVLRASTPFEAHVSQSRVKEQEPDVHDIAAELGRLVWVLFRRKWEVLLVASLVVIPVAIATYYAERLYRSIAQVQVDPAPLQVLPTPDIDQPATRPHYELFMMTQEEVLRGPALRQRVAERLSTDIEAMDLRGEVGRLGGAFAVQRVANTQIFRLGYVAPQPQTAARVANIYAEEFIKLNFDNRQAVRIKAKELLERELETLGQKVQLSDRELVAYAQQNSIPAADPGLAAIQGRMTELRSQLSEAEAELVVEGAKLTKLQRASAVEFPDSLGTPMISTAQGKVAELEHELVALRSTFGENWPSVVQKRAEIALAREQLERERTSALTHAQDQARLDYQLAEGKRNRLASSLAEQKELAQAVETALVQYNILRREVDTSQKMYEAMLERLKRTSMADGMEFGGFHLIGRATPSYRPDSPKTAWNLTLASLLGLALGVCFAIGREFWSGSIRTVDELERLISTPLLGAVPYSGPSRMSLFAGLRTTAKGGLTHAKRVLRIPASVAPFAHRSTVDRMSAEAIRSVCASILLSRSSQPPRTIMVTSAVTGEGKTTLAREISLAFADSGARTLLIECDLRRPNCAAAFGIAAGGGLTLYLSGGSYPQFHPTHHQNLHVVAAGPPAPNPPALLNSERLQVFLDRAAEAFQFIILDAPPVLPVADARVLAPLADGLIMVIRAGLAPRKAIRRASALLEATGTPVLGTILNAADVRDTSNSQYEYYLQYQEN